MSSNHENPKFSQIDNVPDNVPADPEEQRKTVTRELVSTVDLLLEGNMITPRYDQDDNLLIIQNQIKLYETAYADAYFMVTRYGNSKDNNSPFLSPYIPVETYAVYSTHAIKEIEYLPAFQGVKPDNAPPKQTIHSLPFEELTNLLELLKNSRKLGTDKLPS